jgi:hypothetical protein
MPPTNRVYRVAVIPGDGIGKEVVPEGARARGLGEEIRLRGAPGLVRFCESRSVRPVAAAGKRPLCICGFN